MDQPSIHLFGYLIQEPICTLTDLLVAAISLMILLRIGTHSLEKEKRMWQFYFFAMMMATFLGGILGHAFLYKGTFAAMKLPGWLFGMTSMTVLSQISIHLFFSKKQSLYYFICSGMNILIFLLMVGLEIRNLAFKYVQIHSILLLLVFILPLQTWLIRKEKSEKGRIILFSLLMAGIGSIFFTQKIAFYSWFNHIDISHIFLAISVLVMSRAVRAV